MSRTMVFFLNRLRPDADPETYERWLREVDYPTARAIPAIESYEVARIEGPLRDGPRPYDYIEVVEITDLEHYKRDLESLPGREQFVTELRSFIGDAIPIYGTMIE